MGNPMKIRASVKDGVTEVKVLMQHEMETGLRKEADGTPVPAWFITEVKAQHQGRTVLEAQYGQSISKNPYLLFRFKGGAVGEKVTVSWVDNKGDTRSDEAAIAA
jgi:sulfur-oxidizing protein SoxZ